VTGSHGLSVTPTRHELLFHEDSGEQRHFWTWCAWDAVGILAALEASGQVRSTSPSSGAPVEVTFHRGSLYRADPDLVVFFADADCCGSVVEQWCPLVNFFEHAAPPRPGPPSTASAAPRSRWPRRPAGERTPGRSGCLNRIVAPDRCRTSLRRTP
jgi:hypothetical protein